MIIHVIATEIGESTGGKLHTVKAALIKTVRRGFHCGMSNTFIGEFSQNTMQLNRIGCGQRIIIAARWRKDASRSDIGCRKTCISPDLSCERSDGRLAARTGDSDHDFGLFAIKLGGSNCQSVTRIIHMQHRHARIFQSHILARDNRNCAALDCIGSIGRTISLYTLEGRKKEAAFDLTRV